MKKGFTLIELLAVIVILAIIALIATPIVLNIISDVKESSIEASKKIYIRAVEQTIISENTIRPFNPTKCEVIENGNLNCDTGFLEVEVDNTVPIKGTLTIVDGKIVSETLVFKDETNKENKYALKSVATTSEEYGIESVNSCATSGICEAGTPFAIKVNDKETYKFYVISDNGNEVNLIMDRNLTNENLAWCKSGSNNSCNADGIKEYLVTNTSEWANIEQSKISIPTVEQIEIANGGSTIVLYEWLYDNLEKPYGYWLLDPYEHYNNYAYNVYSNGINSAAVTNYSTYGVRPVITIYK